MNTQSLPLAWTAIALLVACDSVQTPVVAGNRAEVAGRAADEALPSPSSMRANGTSCSANAECASGYCESAVCCAKDSDCCNTVADCNAPAGAFTASCADRERCRGVGKRLTCTDDFRCEVASDRNDSACTREIEVSNCGFYPSVFCSGEELQADTPVCATRCANDTDCDANAHCDGGKCVADLANGEPCKRGADCVQGNCKNIKNGIGACCGEKGFCCKAPVDCPDSYRQSPTCSMNTCAGVLIEAACERNLCTSMVTESPAPCVGVELRCGYYKTVTCTADGGACKRTCTTTSDCAANAVCNAAGQCVPSGGS